MTTTRDLPDVHYVMAHLDHTTSAAVPHDDPLAPLARRWLNGKRQEGDEAALRAWLGAHPQYEITRLPAPPSVPLEPAPEFVGQLCVLGGGMTGRPQLLDLFCGAGGAAMGYHRAGFDVVGVDIKPQPHYPFEFQQLDAMEVLHWIVDPVHAKGNYFIGDFDVIHASPPCQAFTQMSAKHRGNGTRADDHPDLLTPTLAILRTLSVPYVVENVQGAKKHMHPTLALHGGMFGLGVDRPRLFECNFLVLAPQAARTKNPLGVYGKAHDGRLLWARADGSEQHAPKTLAEAQAAMGMDWGDWHGVKEAVPPAYTEYIGRALLEHLKAEAA